MTEERLHATAVAIQDRTVLICGASGSGKSALGLQLIGLGADLIADDQVILTRRDDALIATCPDPIRGLIEARGVGLLRATARDRGTVCLAVDLDREEDQRLPPSRHITYLGCAIPLLYRASGIHFASAIAQILRVGRSVPE